MGDPKGSELAELIPMGAPQGLERVVLRQLEALRVPRGAPKDLERAVLITMRGPKGLERVVLRQLGALRA